MKTKTKNLISTLLTLAIAFGLFASMLLTASASAFPLYATPGEDGITLDWGDSVSKRYGSVNIWKKGPSGDYFKIADDAIPPYLDTNVNNLRN